MKAGSALSPVMIEDKHFIERSSNDRRIPKKFVRPITTEAKGHGELIGIPGNYLQYTRVRS